jgi:tetratricopeptide (TPR) repeat protein
MEAAHMSEPLLRIDQLLENVRRLERLGCRQEAQQLLTRLAACQQLPAAAALEVRTRLARAFLRRRRYGAARHHLTAALVHRPRHAYSYFLLALVARKQGDLNRAVAHARRAAELAPLRPRYRAVLGSLLLRLGDREQGVKCLRQALTLAPEDVRILARVVRGLGRAGRWREARRAVQAIRFRLPRCSALTRLWQDVCFGEARHEQCRRRRAEQPAQAEGPTLLPFVASCPPAVAGTTSRLDGPSSLPAPHFPRAFRLSGKKQA